MGLESSLVSTVKCLGSRRSFFPKNCVSPSHPFLLLSVFVVPLFPDIPPCSFFFSGGIHF